MITIIATVLGFILTGIIGNSLIQKWQYANWIRQQRFSGNEKDYIAFRDLATEISMEMGKRIFRMNRIIYSVSSNHTQDIEDKVAAYDESVVSWNEKVNGFSSRLTILSSFYETKRLEDDIQQFFYRGGIEIERLVQLKRAGNPLPRHDLDRAKKTLKKAQINIANFDRDLLKIVEQKRKVCYFGYNISYNEYSLDEFSNIELIKAFFVADVDSHSVSRAP